jgi:hypothetical protein
MRERGAAQVDPAHFLGNGVVSIRAKDLDQDAIRVLEVYGIRSSLLRVEAGSLGPGRAKGIQESLDAVQFFCDLASKTK